MHAMVPPEALCLGARELAHRDALAVLVHMAEVAQADALGNVRAGRHGQLERLLDVLAVVVPRNEERGERAVAGAHRAHELDVELALGVPDVLAVGEVGITAAAASKQDVLDASLVGETHGHAHLVVGIDRHVEDGLHLMMVGLDKQRVGSGELFELAAGEVEDHVGAALLGVLDNLVEEVRRGLGRQRTGDDEAVEIAGGVEDLEELLLALGGEDGARVEDAVLVLAIVEIGVDAGDAVDPHRAAEAAHVHGLVDNVLAGEAREEAEGNGVHAELLEGERHVEALAVGRVARVQGAHVLIRDERGARDGHIDGGIRG